MKNNTTSIKLNKLFCLVLLSLICCPLMKAQNTNEIDQIKIITHFNSKDLFKVSLKYDGELEVIGAKGWQTGGSTSWNGATYYELIIEQEEVTFKAKNLTIFEAAFDSIHHIDLTQCPKLQDLTINGNFLNSIDVAHLPQLETLILYENNDLYEIKNLKKCPKLKQIDCSVTAMKQFDLANNPELLFLTCNHSLVETLNLANNPKLEELICGNSQLKRLDLSKNNKLIKLNCSETPTLTQINLAGATLLEDLHIMGTGVENIDLKDCKSLSYVVLDNNKLKSLRFSGQNLQGISAKNNFIEEADFANCPKLRTITLYNNKLSAKASKALVESLPNVESGFWGNGRLEMVNVTDQNERNIILPNEVNVAKQKNWDTKSLNETTSTIENFAGSQTYKVTLNTTKNGVATIIENTNLNEVPERTELTIQATPNEGSIIESITVNGSPIAINDKNQATFVVRTTTTIQVNFATKQLQPKATFSTSLNEGETLKLYLTSKEQNAWLDLNGNGKKDDGEEYKYDGYKPTEFKLGKVNTLSLYGNIVYLQLIDSKLSKLDVTLLGQLQNLFVGQNDLTELDLTNNTLLHRLSIFENKLTKLDLSNNSKLFMVYASENELGEVILPTNPEQLNRIYLYNNKLTELQTQAIIDKLPQRNWQDKARVFMLDSQSKSETNICTQAQVNEANKRGWNIYDWQGGNNEGRNPYLGSLVATYKLKPELNTRIYALYSQGIISITGAKAFATVTLLNLQGQKLAETQVNEHGEASLAMLAKQKGTYLVLINETAIPFIW